MRIELKENKIVFPDLSYKIVGAAFQVFNDLGWGLSEKDYQSALSKELSDLELDFKREVYIPFYYKNSNLSRYFADFIIEGKILLELKVVSRLGYMHTKQILNYLRNGNLKLGILLYFTKEGVKYRRVLNSSYLI
jgi:GxxExxY protein